MALPGRNEPCPCGSGKKFKHCHLVKAQPFTGITAQDRAAAIDALMRFSRRSEFDGVVTMAALMWLGDGPDDDPQDALADILELPTSSETFFDWLFFDLPVVGGVCMADVCLRRTRSLHPRAADFIRLMIGTHLRPYQTRESKPGEGLRLRDLWTGEDIWVSERSGSHQVVVWDVLAARVHTLPDGTNQFEGSMILLPPPAAKDLAKTLKAQYRKLLKDDPDLTVEQFFKLAAPVMHVYWYDVVANAPPPDLRTAEGDPLTASTLVFDVPKAGDALAALLGAPDFEPGDPGTAIWFEPGADRSRLLGDVRVDRGTLTLEAMSRERAARGRARLEELLGPLRLAREEHREANVQAAGSTMPSSPADDDLPDIADIPELAAMMAEHDRAWIDMEIPALDGATPRAAARSRRLRPILVDLLVDIENREARLARGGLARDVSWLWTELGLKRP